MSVWSLSDLHLSFGTPNKKMDVFGPKWTDHADKIKKNWMEKVSADDLVLIAGDISWALHLKEALIDLKWIDALPGTKVISKGNHDYWWGSNSKVQDALPGSIHLVNNTVFDWNDITIGGTRLWDSEEYNFNDFIEFRDNPLEKKKPKIDPDEALKQQRKIFDREVIRLQTNLGQLNPEASKRIVMVHYPPISADLRASIVSKMLEHFGIDYCVFGHLHNVRENTLPFGEKNGVNYLFTSCDYLDFMPIKVL